MSNLTQYTQKKLLDLTLFGTPFTLPTAYAGLFTDSPGETGSLTEELTGGSYARIELTSKMGATTLGTGIATNSSAVTFATPAVTSLVTHLGVMDAASAGNVLLHVPLLYPFLVGSGTTPAPSFAIGSIQLTALFDGTLSQLTKYAAKKWLDHVLGKAAFTAPTLCYLGMFSADPTSDGSLTDEIATGAYARQNISGVMGATELGTGIASNGDAVTFPSPTASYGVTYFGVLDALTTGNMLLRKARGSTLSVTQGSAAVRIDEAGLQLRAA